MAKIIPVSIVQGISGKICRHDDTYFATNKQTGNVYAVKVCNPSTAEPTEKQIAHRKEFGDKTKVAAAWLNANHPTESSPKGSDAYQSMLLGFKSQHKVGSVMAYVRQHIDESGNVTFSGTQSSGSTTGGGSNFEG